jgi:hypothetical protein
VLTIIAGGAIGASLSFSLLGSRSNEEAELIASFERLDAQRLLERDRMDRLAGAPVITYSAVAPPGSGDLLVCATQQLGAMRYNDMRGGLGYVRGRKDTDRATGDEKNSALSVTIIGQDMHVMAGIITRDKWDMGHGAELMDPTSGEARGDAQRLLAECAGSAGGG